MALPDSPPEKYEADQANSGGEYGDEYGSDNLDQFTDDLGNYEDLGFNEKLNQPTKMLNLYPTVIESLLLHRIGNKSKNEGLLLSGTNGSNDETNAI